MTDQARRAIGQAKAGDAGEVLQAGVAALRANLAEEALPLLAAAVRAHPDDARLWQLKGLLHRTAEDLAPAVEALSTAAALAPADAFIAHSLACATIEAGLPAVDAFERALALAPGDEAPLLGLAESHLAQGETGRAVALLEDRLGRDPSWLQGHLSLARLRTSRGAPQAATAGFERALAALPGAVPLWLAYLQLLYQSERYEETLALVARARAAAGAQRDFDAAEAVATAELGDIEAADRLFEALNPSGDMSLAVPYVRHLLRADRPDRASESAAHALGQAPQPMLWSYLSAAWRLTGDPALAMARGRSAASSESTTWPARCRRSTPWRTGSAPCIAPPTSRSTNRCAAAPRPRVICSSGPSRKSRRCAGPSSRRSRRMSRTCRRATRPSACSRRARSPIRFAGAWSVRLPAGGRHANHIHPAAG